MHLPVGVDIDCSMMGFERRGLLEKMAEVIADILKSLKRGWFFEVVFGSITGILIASDYYFAILGLGAVFAISISIEHPLRALFLLLLILPFSGHEWIVQPLLSVPGAKIGNLLGLYIIFLAFLNYRNANRMSAKSIVFAVLYCGVFTISVYRSLDYLDLVNRMNIETLSIGRYWLSDWMRPIVYFLPFVIVSLYAAATDRIRLVFNTIAISTTCVAAYILFLYFARVPDRLDMDAAAELYSQMLGLHRNQIATFFILGFPFMVSNFFMKKTIYNLIALFVVIAAAGFCFSRTAYATIMGSFILYFLISNRKAYLPILIVLFLACGSIVSTSIIMDRASKGLSSGDISEISAGRTDEIWIPLVREYMGSGKLLLVGQGRYAMLNTEAHKKGIAQDYVMNPHNMYIEMVLDAGLLGLCIVGWFILGTLMTALGLRTEAAVSPFREYYCGSLVSVIAYLVAGLAGLSLFPIIENSFFWVSLAILIVISRQVKSTEANVNESQA